MRLECDGKERRRRRRNRNIPPLITTRRWKPDGSRRSWGKSLGRLTSLFYFILIYFEMNLSNLNIMTFIFIFRSWFCCICNRAVQLFDFKSKSVFCFFEIQDDLQKNISLNQFSKYSSVILFSKSCFVNDSESCHFIDSGFICVWYFIYSIQLHVVAIKGIFFCHFSLQNKDIMFEIIYLFFCSWKRK